MDEFHTTSMLTHQKSLSKDLLSALHELQHHVSLVIVQDVKNEDISRDDYLNSLLQKSGVEISSTLNTIDESLLDHTSIEGVIEQFSQHNSIPTERRYLIHAGLKVSFFSNQLSHDSESFLPKTLTFTFHNYSNLVSWILSHPTPYQDMLTSVSSGAKIIQEGGLVAFPTETVYGLGADATNPSAVENIFTAKKRPLYDPLIVHVSHRDQMLQLVTELPQKAETLIENFWPGPLTIVLPKSSLVPAIVTAGHSSVAIRMPSNPLALELIRLSRKPIAAPSANRFGYTSPTTARHVQEQLEGAYDTIIDGGGCVVGIESTVISFLGETPIILRPGGIDQDAIESHIGKVLSIQHNTSEEKSTSPGMLPSHYATSTPLRIVENFDDYAFRDDVGILLFGKSEQVFAGPEEYLSLSSDVSEAATRLYQAMRKLDNLSLSLLVVKLLPETGIGIAVNNRLIKAAGTP